MNFISLFSGIGGFDLGFERAGMTSAAQVEIDLYALEVLEKHWSDVPKFRDVRKFNYEKHGRTRGAVDLICGGFPCQDLSVAGKRAGLAGKRSGLWFEFHRIISELAPRWVVIENVPGLLSSNEGRDFAVILRGLGELGYLSTWRVLDAQYFGVPQRRRRVFIVASLGDGRSAQVLFEREGLPGDTPPSREAGKEVAYSLRSNPSHSGDKGDGGINTTLVSNPVRTSSGRWMADGSDNSVASSLARGNRLDLDNETYVVAHGQANAEIVSDGEPSLTDNHEAPIVFQQNTRDEVRLMGGDGRYVGALAAEPGAKQQNYVAFTPRASSGRPMSVGDVVPTLESANNGAPAIAWQFHNQDSSVRMQEDTLPTVATQWGTGGNNMPFIGVRRLTPTECARLQGFPDDWNDWLSDSTRYRQFGNAVAVPVVEWIGKRIVEVK